MTVKITILKSTVDDATMVYKTTKPKNTPIPCHFCPKESLDSSDTFFYWEREPKGLDNKFKNNQAFTILTNSELTCCKNCKERHGSGPNHGTTPYECAKVLWEGDPDSRVKKILKERGLRSPAYPPDPLITPEEFRKLNTKDSQEVKKKQGRILVVGSSKK